MNNDGYWNEAAEHRDSIAHLKDTEFSTLMHFVNNLGQHIIKDNTCGAHNMLLKVDVGHKTGRCARNTNKALVIEFLKLECEWLCFCLDYFYGVPK